VYIALGEVEHSTKENVSAYLENEYGTDPTKIETVIDSLYLRGDLLRSPDGTYSSV
jgi:hypothetical protein